MNIGRAIRKIPEEYKGFFWTKKKTPELIGPEFDDKLKLILHLEASDTSAKAPVDDLVLLSEGRREVNEFLGRLRFLLKWGHFVWRLSDLSALHLEPTRVIKPEEEESEQLQGQISKYEMKVHWRLKVVKDSESCFIDGKETKTSLRSLCQVQYYRVRDLLLSQRQRERGTLQSKDSVILYTGISRYVFSGQTGLCTEWHVERIEPKVTGVDLKWRAPMILEQ